MNIKYLLTIINGIGDPVMVVSKDRSIRYMNQAAKVASSSTDASPPRTRNICHDLLRYDTSGEDSPVSTVFNTGKPAKKIYHLLNQKNGQKTVEVSAAPLFSDTGEVKEVVKIIRDISGYRCEKSISEQKETKEELRRSLAELRQQFEELTRIFNLVEVGKREWEKTMDCVSDMIILTDGNGRIRRCNRPLTELTGKPYDALLGKDWKQILAEHGLQTEQFQGPMRELFHQPTNRWFTITGYQVSEIGRDGSSGMVISLHDFTDRKRITQELERTNSEIDENRKNLRTALEKISSLIQQAAQAKTFSVRFENPNLEKCHDKMKCVRKECSCHGKEAMRCWQISGTFSGGDHECAYTKTYGSCHSCPVFECATPDPVFQIGEQFNTMMHILELKNNELEHAYTELKLTQSKILQQDKMASIGQLAAGVAHEINNPMGFISSNLSSLNKYTDKIIEYARTLSETLDDLNDPRISETVREARSIRKFDFIVEDIKKLIAESMDGAERVKTIVQNLKSFSRVDQKEDVFADINECMETTLNIVWNELKYKTTIKKEYASLPLIKCKPQQLNQVFMNLLVNAAHAIEKQGEIKIKTWEQDGSVFTSVSDTGCGISQENLEKIFEPFFTTKEVGKGTGLGLSIAYDIVKKHDGEITVQSEVNKGTTFTVRIPAKTRPGEEY